MFAAEDNKKESVQTSDTLTNYQQELLEKIKDLQQQTRFCLNNYDYYHRNNEMQVLQEKREMLRGGAKVFKEFLQNFDDLQSTLAKVTERCDKVDQLLAKYGVGKPDETVGDYDGGGGQEEEDNDSVSINDKEN